MITKLNKQFDVIALVVPKGRKQAIKEQAKRRGFVTVNAMLNYFAYTFCGMTKEEWENVGYEEQDGI